jgi:hypothetical protein
VGLVMKKKRNFSLREVGCSGSHIVDIGNQDKSLVLACVLDTSHRGDSSCKLDGQVGMDSAFQREN